jgi:hypothetical protein
MTQFQRFLVRFWLILRNPVTTLVLLALLATVTVVGLLVPQRPAAETSLDSWRLMLSPVFQPWSDALFVMGLSRVFQSPWFWIPLGLLSLNCLLALADYAAPSWYRFRHAPADIEWQHPLAIRVEQLVRLPDTPDDRMQTLRAELVAGGFTDTDFVQENDRALGGVRRSWSWLAVISLYGGIFLLIGGALVSFYSLRSEQLLIWPFQTISSPLFDSHVELYQVEEGRATVIFAPRAAGEPAWAFFLRPYIPAFFKGAFILPTALDPVLTFEARDRNGESRRLLPVRADLSPSSQLSLPLDQPDVPLYFLIPSANLAFQIAPTESDGVYQAQIRRSDDTGPGESRTIRLEEPFTIDDISLTMTQRYNIRLLVWRDFGLPILLFGVVITAVSGIILLLLPPWQVWFIPEVKGRGGQLYGVAETIGRAKTATEFLQRRLSQTPENMDDAESTG